MLRAVLRPSSNVGLDNMSSVEERHLAIGLDPDLVAGVLGKDWEGGNVQAELEGLGELACSIDVNGCF